MVGHGKGNGAAADEFRLGEWRVRPALNRLERDQNTVRIRPKLMDLLVLLAERAGGVVPQQTIIDTLWATEFHGDSVLTRCVSELRTILGDDARRPRYIETITRRGYRLIAPVARLAAATTARAGTPCPCALIVGDRRVPLGEGESVIGRAPEAAVRIDSLDVSRRHARIVVSCGRALLEDLGSKNGTFVDGARVNEPVELANGNRISVGPVVLLFRVLGLPGTTVTAPPR